MITEFLQYHGKNLKPAEEIQVDAPGLTVFVESKTDCLKRVMTEYLRIAQFWIARKLIACLPAVRQGIEDATTQCQEIRVCAEHLPGGESYDQPGGETYTPEEARRDVLDEADKAEKTLMRLWL